MPQRQVSSTVFVLHSQSRLTCAELLKRYRPAEDTASAEEPIAQSNGKGKGRAATVGEEDEEEMEYAPGQ